MIYLFAKNGKVKEISCLMMDIEGVTLYQGDLGWSRVWTSPGMIRQLDFNEAYEESVVDMREQEAHVAKIGAEAWNEVREILGPTGEKKRG